DSLRPQQLLHFLLPRLQRPQRQQLLVGLHPPLLADGRVLREGLQQFRLPAALPFPLQAQLVERVRPHRRDLHRGQPRRRRGRHRGRGRQRRESRCRPCVLQRLFGQRRHAAALHAALPLQRQRQPPAPHDEQPQQHAPPPPPGQRNEKHASFLA